MIVMSKYISNEKIKAFSFSDISDAVRTVFTEANYRLPECVSQLINNARDEESDALAKSVLETILENSDAAKRMNIPICQDTGMAVLFAEIGRGVYIDCDFEKAVNDGVKRAYSDGCLRKSIVRDPFYERVNTDDNTPALIHLKMNGSDDLFGKIKLTAAPKGFGSENMSRVKMFTPSATEDEIVSFVVDTVKTAGANPCPPIIVGVGIGSDFEGVTLLAKTALLREKANSDLNYRKLERRLLEEINKTCIGPQGFGGMTTALAVYVESAPTHIAGLPVAVNINCHVARHKTMILE